MGNPGDREKREPDEHPGLSDREEQAEESTSANIELDEEFRHQESDTTRLEQVADESGEDEGEVVEHEDQESQREAETKADDVIDDGLIWM